jgi:hypothetical protein
MGQNESNEIIDIPEWTNYMEWNNYKDFKKGEKYRITFESYEMDAIFCYYEFHGKYGYCENCDAVFKEKIGKRWSFITSDDTFEYYKFISKKEYNSKVKEKYNEKVLNIVLKMLINDDFKW